MCQVAIKQHDDIFFKVVRRGYQAQLAKRHLAKDIDQEAT